MGIETENDEEFNAEFEKMKSEETGIKNTEDDGENTEAEGEGNKDGEEQAETKKGTDRKRERFVPHGALHEERQRRKETEKQLEAERLGRAKLEERLNILAETVKRRNQEAAQAIPAFEEDPANHLRLTAQAERQRVEQLERQVREAHEQSQRSAQDQQFMSAYQARAMEFSQRTPDFRDAYQHAMRARIEDYKVMGHTDEEAMRFTLNDERAIAMGAMQRGLNPAEVIYNLAKRAGYTRKTQEADIETAAKGVAASKSLGSISGRTGASKLSLDAIANMTDEEFSKATSGENWERLWG